MTTTTNSTVDAPQLQEEAKQSSPYASFVITGANVGLGRETARLLVTHYTGISRIYLAGRNASKLETARLELLAETGCRDDLLVTALLDTADLDSCRNFGNQLPEPIDCLIMNAGGLVGPDFARPMLNSGVWQIHQVNVVGHLCLVEELVRCQKVRQAVLLAGSEAARGVGFVFQAPPNMKGASVDHFVSILDGSFFGKFPSINAVYGYSKLVGTLAMASLARQHPHLRWVTVSPGSSTGTNCVDQWPFLKRLLVKNVLFPMLRLTRKGHTVMEGAQRYVDVAVWPETYATGKFYASQGNTLSGPLVDQAKVVPEMFYHAEMEDQAYEAVARIYKEKTV